MSHYEKSGPGGVGKRYGALDVGGISGITQGANGFYLLDFETSAPEIEALNAQEFEIPSSYGLMGGVYPIEVGEAFDAGTIDILYDGVSVLVAPISLTTAGMAIGTGLNPLETIETGKKITVVVAGVTGTAGYLKSMIEISRI